MKKLNNEIMLRIRNVETLDKLQEMYQKTKFRSMNEFLNYLLKEAVFRPINGEEIKKYLESVDTFTQAIWDKVQHIDRTIEIQHRN